MHRLPSPLLAKPDQQRAGASSKADAATATPTVDLVETVNQWSAVTPGAWLRSTLAQLSGETRDGALALPDQQAQQDTGLLKDLPGDAPQLLAQSSALALDGLLQAKLRPYQTAGLQWLWTLHQLGIGGCLADDMGLGKTLQVLALLLAIAKQRRSTKAIKSPPHLIVAPATLIGNWEAEAAKFAPSLRLFIAHRSRQSSQSLQTQPKECAHSDNHTDNSVDVVITTYGSLLRYSWLSEGSWSTVVLDEAQAIKNPAAQQTQAVKSLKSRHRLALTGTPVENRPADLWSLFDFLNPGLLGTLSAFEAHLRAQKAQQADLEAGKPGELVPYAQVRALIQPYLLRRLKTDPKIISDLPPKTELTVRCTLTPQQAALYARVVDELRNELRNELGQQPHQQSSNDDRHDERQAMQRRGAVLSALLKLKQICSHPSLVMGDGVFSAAGSGKLRRLLEIADEIAQRQEKLLVFTQFRAMTTVLAQQLSHLFGRPGCVLHGDTPVAERQALVERFQKNDGPPFFVLSVKAGGTGLTLTQAAHVIHYDRWWNPAVEDQATDRAYRIGQKQPVMVHKFVCMGTIEAKIADLLASKRQLADALLSGNNELNLTELDDEALLRLMTLDLPQVADDAPD
jgi:non-specific serine/threonine protein kinase